MDTDKQKDVISKINEITGKAYNILSFDLIQPEQLIQILSHTLAYVEGSQPVDTQQENLEDTVMRILETLRILKYKLPTSMTPALFRQGLVKGDKKIIHPIVDWLVSNMEDLKKRAYLAMYLVKLDIPAEFSSDPDVEYLYEQYEAHIDEFKAVHKESEILKDSTVSIAELKADIKSMESEKDSVMKKVDKLKRQTENLPDHDKLLEIAKALRTERERRKELMEHEVQQQNQLAANEHKLQRLSTQLKELRQNVGRTQPHELLRRLEEEASVNAYLAQQKMPMEIRGREEDIRMYEMVLSEPSLTRAHLDDLNFKIQQVSEEVNQKIQAQLSEQNQGEDKNAPFRQQAAIIGRKKEAKAEQLSELRSEQAAVEEELAIKQKQLHEVAGETVLRGDDLKKYVGKLRVKGAQYKKQKAQLATLKTEAGILTRTVEILSSKDATVMQALEEEEALHGVQGYRQTRSILETVSQNKSDMDAMKGQTLDEMSKLVIELNKKISEKKNELEPLIAALRPLREQHAETKDQYEHLKKAYDATASGLENATLQLEQEVKKMQTEFDDAEEEVARLQRDIEKAEGDMIKVEAEVKLYISGSPEAKKNSLREQLQQKIAEQEKVGKQLKEEQAALKDLQAKSALQVRFWKDIERLFKCKFECMEDERKNAGVVRREKGAETLILPQ